MRSYNQEPKVAASVKLTSLDSTLRDIDLAVKEEADIVEIRADFYPGIVPKSILERVLNHGEIPKIYTNRHKGEAGPDIAAGFKGSEEEREELLAYAIDLKVRVVDIEWSHLLKYKQTSETFVILSHHDFKRTPRNLLKLYRMMSRERASIIKIATAGNLPEDEIRMLGLINTVQTLQELDSPSSPLPWPDIIGVCMGEYSYLPRVFGPLYGGAFTYGSLDESKEVVKGQIPVRRLKQIWREILNT